MLSVFPELLTFELLAPFLLRVVVGLILINLGWMKFKGEKARWEGFFDAIGWRPKETFVIVFGLIEIVGGGLLLIGLYTQVAALVIAVINFAELHVERKESVLLKRDAIFYLFIFVISISLLLTGPGFFAFDLPL
jgi:putative oxidoreductase